MIIHKISQFLSSLLIRVHLVKKKGCFRIAVNTDTQGRTYLFIKQENFKGHVLYGYDSELPSKLEAEGLSPKEIEYALELVRMTRIRYVTATKGPRYAPRNEKQRSHHD